MRLSASKHVPSGRYSPHRVAPGNAWELTCQYHADGLSRYSRRRRGRSTGAVLRRSSQFEVQISSTLVSQYMPKACVCPCVSYVDYVTPVRCRNAEDYFRYVIWLALRRRWNGNAGISTVKVDVKVVWVPDYLSSTSALGRKRTFWKC